MRELPPLWAPRLCFGRNNRGRVDRGVLPVPWLSNTPRHFLATDFSVLYAYFTTISAKRAHHTTSHAFTSVLRQHAV
jgi:hypothetical protein